MPLGAPENFPSKIRMRSPTPADIPSKYTMTMQSPYYAPPHVASSRPSLSFPLGTALLLIVIFSLSGIFSCWYHWEKLRSLRGSFSDDIDGPTKPTPAHTNLKQYENESLPVLMPGDRIAKFIALPCPCQPMRPELVVVVVELPKLPPQVVAPL